MFTPTFGALLRRALAALAVCGAPGCATIASEYAATPVDAQGRVMSARTTPAGLAISGGELDSYGSAFFSLIEITFENRTAQWLHIDT